MKRKRARSRRGFLLIIVLIVVAALALAAYTFAEMMLAHHEAAQLSGRKIQCEALVESGVEVVRAHLMQPAALRVQTGGDYDNPQQFQGVLVVDDPDPAFRARFTVVAPYVDDYGDSAGVRYGLQNESARVNLNALAYLDDLVDGAGRELLMGLPGMTEEVADSILDYLDEDDQPRELGAEINYYSSRSPPYAPKNGPLESVEELLKVRGVTPELLFGMDTNRNGMIDDREMASPSATIIQDGAGSLSLGWASYLTLYSIERNVTIDGQPRIYLNNSDLQALFDELTAVMDESWATFIIAYRQAEEDYDGDDEGQTLSSGDLDLEGRARREIPSVLDLIGKKIELEVEGEDDPIVVESPFADDPGAMQEYLTQLMDQVTVFDQPTLPPGRINIHQAPRAVLLGIPGMSEPIVDQIMAMRSPEAAAGDPNLQHEAWLLAQGIVTLEEMRAILPFVTAGGDVFRVQVVGYYENGSASARAEAVIDATSAVPRIVFWRDLSNLGRGYPLEVLGSL